MFSKEVGIDLGTANLLMYVKGEGTGNPSSEGWGYCGFRGNGNHAELLFQEAGYQGDV